MTDNGYRDYDPRRGDRATVEPWIEDVIAGFGPEAVERKYELFSDGPNDLTMMKVFEFDGRPVAFVAAQADYTSGSFIDAAPFGGPSSGIPLIEYVTIHVEFVVGDTGFALVERACRYVLHRVISEWDRDQRRNGYLPRCLIVESGRKQGLFLGNMLARLFPEGTINSFVSYDPDKVAMIGAGFIVPMNGGVG